MAWIRRFETGEAVVDGVSVWGTAMYDDPDSGLILFRIHPRNVGMSPSHNPPTPDPGAVVVSRKEFTAIVWSAEGTAGQ